MSLKIDHYLHFVRPADAQFETTVLGYLQTLTAKVNLMTTKFDDILARIDAATNKIAAKLDALAAQIKTDMSAAEVAEARATLSAEADKLEGLGADPANPVPEPAPPPAP